jgi:hypothetical protein
VKSLLLLLLSTTLAFTADATQPVGWEIASAGPASVAVPKEWRNFDGIQPSMLIYRQGDGISVPAADETGAPLQIGITVERFAPTADSLETVAKKTAAGAARDPRLQPEGEERLIPVVLSDQRQGLLQTKVFIKSTYRRSLQIKLFVKDADTAVWVASGYIGGKESRLPTADSHLAAWLRAHLLSLTADEKIDTKALETAYRTFATVPHAPKDAPNP